MKNDIITLTITDITPEGFGVGRYEGKAFFVADTAIGDEICALVLKENKNHGFAKIVSVQKSSPDRVDDECPNGRKCGGCVFRHISYDAEKELKRNIVKNAFLRIGKMDLTVEPTVFSTDVRYRNKVQYPFAPNNGRVSFGYYAPRSHRIVEHKTCLLQDEIFTNIASFCAKTAESLGLAAFDEQSGKGVLRHLVMRKNRVGEILLCVVVFKNDKKLLTLAEMLKSRFENIVGVHLNINKRRDNVIFGDETLLLLGQDVLRDTLCGKTFELSPRAFYQVNADMAEKLYSFAKSLLKKRDGIILDLYCGVGTIGICLADDNAKLCGVEIIDSAVENAKKNAILNGRTEDNSLFVCGDASMGVEECKKRFGTPDTIIVDPPRKGLDKSVIDTIVSANPDEIIYISCDPATLARDCAIFKEQGYVTSAATPFDLFPRTGHVETVVKLTR